MGALAKRLGGLAGQIAPSWWRWIAYGTLVFSAAALLVGWGYSKGVERLYTYQAEQARQAVAIRFAHPREERSNRLCQCCCGIHSLPSCRALRDRAL